MRDHAQHVSDEDLLLAVDDELGKRANRVWKHLQLCPPCRARAAQTENILSDLARAPQIELPPIATSRAALRVRLVESSLHKTGFYAGLNFSHSVPARSLAMAAIAVVLVLAGTLALRRSDAPAAIMSLFSSQSGVLPNPAFTPGVSRPVSLDQVCSLPHEEVVKEVSSATRQRIFEEYGIPSTLSNQYEVDYLIAPGLGGSDDIRNLWPEPYRHAKWNARVKDELEERLHELVCSHQVDLAAAQQAIATDWIAAYRRYMRHDTSSARMKGTALLAWTARSILFGQDHESAQPFTGSRSRKPGVLQAECLGCDRLTRSI